MRLTRWLVTLGTLLALPSAAPAATPTLRAGAGMADITPRLGYYLGGWTRADRIAQGQHTRLHARALVLQRGDRKLALVAIDLFMVPGGMVKHLGDALAARGFSEQNLLISASHTHSGPGGYANFPTLNTAAPSMETATDPSSFMSLLNPGPADPELYHFLLNQIRAAIERADDDLAPAAAAWGSERITGLTRNRSVEAHLNNHGIERGYGEGQPGDDPLGPIHTIDPDVNVLRVDQLRRRRGRTVRVPIGAWSTFADHGTVTKSTFEYYNGDHNASAMRVFETRVRRVGRVPASRPVVNVYGNSNEGDMSAGLDRHGPAASEFVGRIEASAMFRAWRAAGRRLSRRPALDWRWTRICFCGQMTAAGPVASSDQVGLPFLTGSEEERGPLFDITGQHYEGTTNPAATGPQAPKAGLDYASNAPTHVPLMAVRVGPRVIVSIPGEGTKEVGARIRAAVGEAVAGHGIEGVVVSGLANEFVLYFTTPEEYDRQHYEGGNTHFGRASSVLVQESLAAVAGALVRGQPALAPVPFDPTNGVSPDGPEYGAGAASGTIVDQPASRVARLNRARLVWQGGPQGLDRPVDRAFVIAERLQRRRWVRADDDLGLAMLWTVDPDGRHTALWEIPRDMPAGRYRLRVDAKRYGLTSQEFAVAPAGTLTLEQAPAAPGRVAVSLRYPEAVRDVDLTYRPRTAKLGAVRFRVNGRLVRVRGHGRRVVSTRAPAGSSVTVESAVDLYGNSSRNPIELR